MGKHPFTITREEYNRWCVQELLKKRQAILNNNRLPLSAGMWAWASALALTFVAVML